MADEKYFGHTFNFMADIDTEKYRSIQNYHPRKIMISELIRRGVIYHAGNFLPQIIFAELIMRGNSVSHDVDRLFWG